jgi:hypothetical protein
MEYTKKGNSKRVGEYNVELYRNLIKNNEEERRKKDKL